jgi:hypothetical protein
MEGHEIRTNIGMRNPYALADYIDSQHEKPKKDWNKIFLGLEIEPEFDDVLSSMIASLEREPEFKKKTLTSLALFNPKSGSPLYNPLPLSKKWLDPKEVK